MENLELAIQGEIHTGTWSTAKMLSGRFALCWSHCHGSHTDKNRYYITAHAAYMRGSQTVAIFWDLTSKSNNTCLVLAFLCIAACSLFLKICTSGSFMIHPISSVGASFYVKVLCYNLRFIQRRCCPRLLYGDLHFHQSHHSHQSRQRLLDVHVQRRHHSHSSFSRLRFLSSSWSGSSRSPGCARSSV